MSTVSPQPQLPKGFRLSKKLKRFILFAFFFGLFAFSMTLFLKAKFHHHHHHKHSPSDRSIYDLTQEIRQLKLKQNGQDASIQNLYQTIHEMQWAYNNLQTQAQQQDENIKAFMRNTEMDKQYHQGDLPGKNKVILELAGAQKDLSNRLEAFRSVLQGFETKINNNNQKIVEDMKEVKKSLSSVSKPDLDALHRTHLNTQKQILNQINNQENRINELSQNQVRHYNEAKEISRGVNNLQAYTVEAVKQLGRHNTEIDQKVFQIEKNRMPSTSNVKQSEDVSTLVKDLESFKEYTMEALNEIRIQNNKNTKKINHIESKDNSSGALPIADMVSQEIDKFFNKLTDGNLLSTLLQQTNISTREAKVLIDIIQRIARGDIDGIMSVLNQLSHGKLDSWMKYASWINTFMGGKSAGETSNGNSESQDQGQRNYNGKHQYGLKDLLESFYQK